MEYKSEYLNLAKQSQTLKELAEKIGTDEQSIVTLARSFDDNQNLKHPEFFIAVYKLAANEKECDSCKPGSGKTINTNDKNQCVVCGRTIIFIETTEEKKKRERLDIKREKFCQLYTSPTEFFGNGVQSYIEVYEPDQTKPNWYKIACQSASQLLSNIKVCERINELLEVGGFNDENVDKQLLFVINQNADFSSKVAAVREYNKLKKRISDKLQVEGNLTLTMTDYKNE